MENNTFNTFKDVIIVASAKKQDNTMSKEASDAVAWGGVIAFVTGVAMAVKAAFTDDKKEDQK